jgi:hypothetical protein
MDIIPNAVHFLFFKIRNIHYINHKGVVVRLRYPLSLVVRRKIIYRSSF